MSNQILYCRCGIEITKSLERTNTILPADDGKPLVPRGKIYQVDDNFDDWTNAKTGDWLVNKEDLKNCVDGGIRNGCCGVDGQDGLNIFCSKGHDIGTEVSDCWTPHFVLVDQSKIWDQKPHWVKSDDL